MVDQRERDGESKTNMKGGRQEKEGDRDGEIGRDKKGRQKERDEISF